MTAPGRPGRPLAQDRPGQPLAPGPVSRTAARRLLAEAAEGRGYLIAACLLGLVVTGLILAQAKLLAHVLASAANGAAAAALRGTVLMLLVVVAGRAAAVWAGETTALRGAAVIKQRLRSRLARHVLELGPAWLGRERPGEIGTLGTTGLDALDPYFARYLPQLVLAVAVPLAVLATVTAADWVSGLIIAVTLPLIPVFAALVGLRTKAQAARSWQLLARLSGHFLDVVQGLPTLKLFGRAAAQERVIAETTMRYRASVMATLRIAFLSALILELSASLATALVAVEVGLRLLYGHLGYATALLVLLLTPEAYLPLRNLAAHRHASADGVAAADRVFGILDTSVPVPPPRRIAAMPDLRSEPIRLNRTFVVHPGRVRPVIAGLNLIVRPGDRIILTGESGAGKTTLLSLLLRFIAPAAGVIDVGGMDLTSIPVGQWREQIGWLPQHPALFGWSVAENIALGNPGASRTDVERAAELAGASSFVTALPRGYDTVLDENARRLSAGQRQKLALARLFLKNAPFLLLDEPTAHLDPVSAAEVAATTGTLATGRTVIVVTHRDKALFRATLAGPAAPGSGSPPIAAALAPRTTATAGLGPVGSPASAPAVRILHVSDGSVCEPALGEVPA